MKMIVIAVHCNNAGSIIGYRIMDKDTHDIIDQPSKNVKAVLNRGMTIEGLELEHDKIKGSNGSLDRYTKLLNKNALNNQVSIVILKAIDNNLGYEVAFPDGRVQTFRSDDIIGGIESNEKMSIANGKIVDGQSGKFISSIRGTYDNINSEDILNKKKMERKESLDTAKELKNNADTSKELDLIKQTYNDSVVDSFQVKADDNSGRFITIRGIGCDSKLTKQIDEDLGMSVEDKIIYAEYAIKIKRPFYYYILMSLNKRYTLEVDTLAVSTGNLYINPNFVLKVSLPELVFIVLHEICHVAMMHTSRGVDKDGEVWNIATDLFVNEHLIDELGAHRDHTPVQFNRPNEHDDKYKVAFPDGALSNCNIDLANDLVENIYNDLMDLKMKTPQQQNQGGQQGGQSGKQGGQQGSQSGQQGSQSGQQGNQSGNQSGQDGQQGNQNGQQSGNQSGQQSGQQGGQGGQNSQGNNDGSQPGQDGQRNQNGNENQSDQGNGSQTQSGKQNKTGTQNQTGTGSNSNTDSSDKSTKTYGNNIGKTTSELGKISEKHGQQGQNGQNGQQNQYGGTSDNADQSKGQRNSLAGQVYRGQKIGDTVSKDIVLDETNSGTKEQVRQNAETILARAVTLAKKHIQGFGGDSASFIERMVLNELAPKVNWKSLLKNMLTRASQKINTFSAPDKRYRQRGIIVPGPKPLENDTLENIKICIDTSGSISDKDIGMALAQIKQLLGTYKAKAELLYWDTRVRAVYPFENIKDIVDKKPYGGGGTDANCIFDYFETNREYKIGRKKKPEIVIVFTDGYFGDIDKKYSKYKNTIWIINGDSSHFTVPFGKLATFKIDN